MSQRTVQSKRCGNVTLRAWTVSIAVHIIVLTVLGVTKFSQCGTAGKQWPAPVTRISRIKQLMQTGPIIPKPKVKKPPPATEIGRFARRTGRIPITSRIFDTAKPGSQNSVNFSKVSASQKAFALAGSGILPKGIGFFGSWTEQRKVCYVVDCSGSMQGLFGQVRKKLAESIRNLQPDQYFYIIFFGGDRLLEFGDGRLIRATQQAKSAAYDFIDLVQPAGQTNALAALERAMEIRDGRGVSASVIYFLTDGFELTNKDEQRFPQKIADLQKRVSPRTKINTIGFWPQDKERKILEAIARQTGGEFVLVDDDNN